MALSLSLPFPPMEASLVDRIPTGEGWQYEPKWNGLRCLAFKDVNIELQSKSGQSLNRYFPELIAALHGIKSKRFVLDGEIVIPKDESFSFDNLLERTRPAAIRVQKLEQEFPAKMIIFDLLVFGDWKLLVSQPLKERRRCLEIFFVQYLAQDRTFQLSPATCQIEIARRWLKMADDRMNGIIAKRWALTYHSGKRTGMQKIERPRAADCVQHLKWRT